VRILLNGITHAASVVFIVFVTVAYWEKVAVCLLTLDGSIHQFHCQQPINPVQNKFANCNCWQVTLLMHDFGTEN